MSAKSKLKTMPNDGQEMNFSLWESERRKMFGDISTPPGKLFRLSSPSILINSRKWITTLWKLIGFTLWHRVNVCAFVDVCYLVRLTNSFWMINFAFQRRCEDFVWDFVVSKTKVHDMNRKSYENELQFEFNISFKVWFIWPTKVLTQNLFQTFHIFLSLSSFKIKFLHTPLCISFRLLLLILNWIFCFHLKI